MRSSRQLPVVSCQQGDLRSDGRPRPPSLIEVEGARPGATRHAFLRWLKFNFVGGVGIAVQLAALAVFRSTLGLNYLAATALAVETAVIHNFVWHERFTWADRPSGRLIHSLARLAKFNVSSGGVSIIGNLLLMRLLVGEVHLNYFAANLAAIASCSLANFLLSDLLVFRRDPILAAENAARMGHLRPEGNSRW